MKCPDCETPVEAVNTSRGSRKAKCPNPDCGLSFLVPKAKFKGAPSPAPKPDPAPAPVDPPAPKRRSFWQELFSDDY